jgi:hypothetical protein
MGRSANSIAASVRLGSIAPSQRQQRRSVGPDGQPQRRSGSVIGQTTASQRRTVAATLRQQRRSVAASQRCSTTHPRSVPFCPSTLDCFEIKVRRAKADFSIAL